MAVIIRKTIDGKEKKTYKTNLEKVTPTIAKEADALDAKIEKEITRIEAEAKKKGLLELKSKKTGVVELYHFVGKELRPFVDGLILSKGDRQYIWNAINYHSKHLQVGESNKRLRRDPVTSHWSYFYRLGGYEWDDVKEYDWTQWVEILDSKITSYDERIIPWLIDKKKKFFKDGSLQEWFRPIMRELRNYLKDYDTTVLSEEELYSELNMAFKKV